MENIQDIYPLSPMQEGMLFHSIYSPDSEEYREQFYCTLIGPLNIDAFKLAWQKIIELILWEQPKDKWQCNIE